MSIEGKGIRLVEGREVPVTEDKERSNKNEEHQFSISVEKKQNSGNQRVVDLSIKDVNGATVNRVCVGIFPNF